jgi:hypothetical protein
MTIDEVLASLVVRLPAPPAVVPVAFLEDDTLPRALPPLEPCAYALACVQGLWGPCGPGN